MFRVAIVSVLAGLGPFALAHRMIVWAADTSPADPTSFLPSLGIGGAAASILYLWQRDTAKQRDQNAERIDRLLDQLPEFVAALREIKVAVDGSTVAHQAATKAAEAMSEMMEYRWPDPPASRPRRSPG